MSCEINQQRQCQTCLACFTTNDALCAHLERYRVQERLLSADLEQCRAHLSQLNDGYDISESNSRDDNDANDWGNCTTVGEVHGTTSLGWTIDERDNRLRCPYEECDRNNPFAKRQRLIANCASSADVRCKEVCVYCFEVFTLASQYIAHADTHKESNTTKKSYTQQICDELKKSVTVSLDQCQSRGVETKKRGLESAEEPARRLKAKLDNNNHINSLHQSHSLDCADVNPLQSSLDEPPMQPETTPVPLFNITEPVATNSEFVGISPQFLQPNSTGVSARLPVDLSNENYGAPVFWAVTYPSNLAAHQEMSHTDTNMMHPSSDPGFGRYGTML